ncbi:MAG TPA: HAD-IIB family hydrolase [Gammaproteobacteria bacterium]|nr:HAD-IIB family hydrolase [Gammaproteobacteria bacterium]
MHQTRMTAALYPKTLKISLRRPVDSERQSTYTARSENRRGQGGRTDHCLDPQAAPAGEILMRYLALCCDYDGTLAHDGKVSDATLAALERVLASGRRLVLVTGRELDDLQAAFPQLELFERVVAENGALLYRPGNREERPLAAPE